MSTTPLISVITPSFNQAAYIEDTIRSVMMQDHPSWEHIVVDGGSTDGTRDILARYPHLRWVAEPDRGQADAVNKGLRLARGEIIGWLNSDDTYLPGALAVAARELDRGRDRWIIMGQCEFIDERTPTGIFHPRAYRGRRRLIEVWKGHTIPQPSVFFFKDVVATCGGLDDTLYFGLDYDLFLRFSAHYWFHAVDVPLATYRLHGDSKTRAISERALLEHSLAISRRHWGPRYSPWFWYFWLSCYATQWPIRRAANRWWNRAARRHAQGHLAAAAGCLTAAVLLSPSLLWRRGQYPAFELLKRALGPRRARRLVGLPAPAAPPPVAIEGAIAADGWMADHAVVQCHSVGAARWIAVEGEVDLGHFAGAPLTITVAVNGEPTGRHTVERSGHFLARLALPAALTGTLTVRIEADRVFERDGQRRSVVLQRVYAAAE